MAAIRLSSLTKTYDNGFQAVKGINLEIRDREFMVLVGPSGCGKTTSLRMVAGLEHVTSGDLFIGERRVNDVDPKDRDIAMVFQSYALYPQMTVAENLGYALTLRRMPKDQIAERVAETARMLSLDGMLTKLPRQLSGGQRQRVAVGRAIIRHPQVFLFDEPLSNLDAKLRGEMRAELRTLQARLATTALYVTHDQIEAMTLGDRITVMNGGHIQQVGEPMAIYEFPWNRFVANFIGSPPMNFLPGQLTHGGTAIQVGRTNIQLLMSRAGELAARFGTEVVLGIRPEHLLPGVHPGMPTVRMAVTLVELMGDHQYLHLRAEEAGGSSCILKTGTQIRPQAGEALEVSLDTRQAHVFEAGGDDARNLTLPADFRQQQ